MFQLVPAERCRRLQPCKRPAQAATRRGPCVTAAAPPARRPAPPLPKLQSQTFSEASGPGRDYLAEVCREWEAAAQQAQARVVVLRTGIVLAKEVGVRAGKGGGA